MSDVGLFDFGERVTVIRRTDPGRDVYGKPIPGATIPEDVDNVVVAPPDTSVLTQLGSDVTATLHFPKGYDPTTLVGVEIEVRGQTYAVIGDPVSYKPDATPGEWCTPVHVGRSRKDGGAYGD